MGVYREENCYNGSQENSEIVPNERKEVMGTSMNSISGKDDLRLGIGLCCYFRGTLQMFLCGHVT